LDSRFSRLDGSFGERLGARSLDMIVDDRRMVNVLFFASSEAAADLRHSRLIAQRFFSSCSFR
jgi:hypothetical protein